MLELAHIEFFHQRWHVDTEASPQPLLSPYQPPIGLPADRPHACDTAEAVIDAIHPIDALQIKGLGPAVANLLYFIHPTQVLPFNTAIVRGYNALTGSNVKLGRWDHYLSLREGAIRLNREHRGRLSNDLGAVAGLQFDIGSGRYPAPPPTDNADPRTAWITDLEKVREESAAAQSSVPPSARATPPIPRSRAGCATSARRWATAAGRTGAGNSQMAASPSCRQRSPRDSMRCA